MFVFVGCDAALVRAKNWFPNTWIELAVLLEYDDETSAWNNFFVVGFC